jgi:D-glycero-alpha-D-manno-heptose 1-phosphate guanylyltransferase
MKAIILAGGKGTRLQSVISDIPKPMAPVGGKPFLEYLLLQLKSWRIYDVILSVCYKKESIMTYFSNGSRWGMNISYVQEQVPLGTGGAIRVAMQTCDDQNILVTNGDSFFNVDMSDLIAFHGKKNARVTLALLAMADTGRYGRVILNENAEISEFREKQGNSEGLINAGVYVINRNVLSYMPEGPCSFETEILPRLTGNGLYGQVQNGFFIDIGIPEDYQTITGHPEQLEARRGV